MRNFDGNKTFLIATDSSIDLKLFSNVLMRSNTFASQIASSGTVPALFSRGTDR